MFVSWLPFVSIIIFLQVPGIKGSPSQGTVDYVIDAFALLSTQYGTLFASVFFLSSREARNHWLKFLGINFSSARSRADSTMTDDQLSEIRFLSFALDGAKAKALEEGTDDRGNDDTSISVISTRGVGGGVEGGVTSVIRLTNISSSLSSISSSASPSFASPSFIHHASNLPSNAPSSVQSPMITTEQLNASLQSSFTGNVDKGGDSISN